MEILLFLKELVKLFSNKKPPTSTSEAQVNVNVFLVNNLNRKEDNSD